MKKITPLRENQKITWIRDELPPTKSPNTELICAWLTAGGKLVEGSPFQYTVEEHCGETKTSVVWNIDGDIDVDFEKYTLVDDSKQLFKKEKDTVSFVEFRSRWLDDKWTEANPDHGIAFMKFFRQNMKQLMKFLKEQKPLIRIKTPGGVALIPMDATEEQRNKILSGF
jgi:hypothetical protein